MKRTKKPERLIKAGAWHQQGNCKAREEIVQVGTERTRRILFIRGGVGMVFTLDEVFDAAEVLDLVCDLIEDREKSDA